MVDMVYSGLIDDIDVLVASCQFSPEAYVLVEQTPRHVVTGKQGGKERQNLLLFLRLSDLATDQFRGICLKDYTSGRVFDQNAELRWELAEQTEQQKSKFHVVYVGTERAQSPIKNDDENDNEPVEKLDEPPDTCYFLFGERLSPKDVETIGSPAKKGDFAQLRIPRLLRYPSPQNGLEARRLRLAVREYVDEETGEVQLFRFRDLQAGE